MRSLATKLLVVLAASAALHGAPTSARRVPRTALPSADVGQAAPALEGYTRTVLVEDLWKRPGLSPRDRSLVTLAALITRNQAAELSAARVTRGVFVKRRIPDEQLPPTTGPRLAIDETAEANRAAITHLAFYAGWPNAVSAVAVAKDVFAKRASQPQ